MSGNTKPAPKLLPYTTWPHGGGKVSWFDPTPPTESWRGKEQNDEIGLHKGFWHLFRTHDGIWISCFGFDEYRPSIRRATGQEIHHYQVLPEGANRWFAKNNQSPPEILLRDLKAAKASSEQDPFVLRAPNGVLFAYGNLDAARKIDVDAMAGGPVAEAGRVIVVTNFGLLARYTYEQEKIRKQFNAPDGEWGDYPEEVNRLLGNIAAGIWLAPGIKELAHYLNTELGENVNTEALVEVKRRISKRHKIDFDEINRLPIAEVVRLLKAEAAGPPAHPREDEKTAAASTTHQRKSEGVGAGDCAPTPKMFRAFWAEQQGIRQTVIGDQLGVSQPTVHRYVKRVKEWIAAGNKPPGLETLPRPNPRSRTFPVDPRKMGRNTEDDGIDGEDDE